MQFFICLLLTIINYSLTSSTRSACSQLIKSIHQSNMCLCCDDEPLIFADQTSCIFHLDRGMCHVYTIIIFLISGIMILITDYKSLFVALHNLVVRSLHVKLFYELSCKDCTFNCSVAILHQLVQNCVYQIVERGLRDVKVGLVSIWEDWVKKRSHQIPSNPNPFGAGKPPLPNEALLAYQQWKQDFVW